MRNGPASLYREFMMPLVLVRAARQFSRPIGHHRSGRGVFRLALIQTDVDAAPQFAQLRRPMFYLALSS
jgi:hypothetical protein